MRNNWITIYKRYTQKMSETPPTNNTFLTEQMPFEMSSIKQFGIIHAPKPTLCWSSCFSVRPRASYGAWSVYY